MRSITWVTILVSLFMFQSFWNVAAAFCVHEESISTTQNYHFGHHTDALCVNDSQKHLVDQNLQVKDSNVGLSEDHQDHLPSMIHLILEHRQTPVINTLFLPSAIAKYFWQNDYNPPDLSSQNPPPEFAPLMVG